MKRRYDKDYLTNLIVKCLDSSFSCEEINEVIKTECVSFKDDNTYDIYLGEIPPKDYVRIVYELEGMLFVFNYLN